MKLKILAFTAAIILFFIASPTSADISKVLSSGVQRIALTWHDQTQCSAAPISQTTFLTAAHCVEGVNEEDLLTGKEHYVVHVVRANKDVDLALLEAEKAQVKPFDIGKAPKEGAPLVMMGFPGNDLGTPSFPALIVGGYQGDFDLFGLGHVPVGLRGVMSVGSLGGMSGGAVVDMDGKLVGINQMADARGGSLSAFSSYPAFRAFLAK